MKVIIAAIAALTLACATPAHADTPTATADINCNTATVTTAGWPDGTTVILGLGETNRGIAANGTYIGEVHGNNWNNYYIDGLNWSLLVYGPGGEGAQSSQGVVYCTADNYPVDIPSPEPAVVDIGTPPEQGVPASTPPTTEPAPAPVQYEASATHPGLELAPPW